MRRLLSRLGLVRRTGLGRALGLPGSLDFHAQRRIAQRARELPAPGPGEDFEQAAAAAAAALREGGPDARIEALALAAEAMRRGTGLDPFPEQLTAAVALDEGLAVEMATGEGKTVAGALAAALAGLAGRRVHVLGVNDYLAGRDAAWMGPFFELLGLRAAAIRSGDEPERRRRAYRAEIVYAPTAELGYDLLRDRFAEEPGERLDPVLDVAIVDEVDAVLVDDASVPLVLAGESEGPVEADPGVQALLDRHVRPGSYETDDAGANVWFTDETLAAIEEELGAALHDPEHTPLLTELQLGLHARVLLERDVDYIVAEEGVRLIDAARGRVARLQRWPDGLHAAVEAKEGLRVSRRSRVLDGMTVQELLGRFERLSGMSGTVLPVAEQLQEFYGLECGRIERRLPSARTDEEERVHASRRERDAALVEEAVQRHRRGQPVLIGTQSIAESERLARLLRRARARPIVLNAKNDAEEAAIVAGAGRRGALTISTQISGRGVDILLGGGDPGQAEEVRGLGGLAVLAAGRYPSARLDRQLAGRAGRQGDPGVHIVFSSLADELPVQHLQAAELRAAEGDPARARRCLAEAQRIAEGLRLDRHRAARDYGLVLARQREFVLRRRERVLGSAQEAAALLAEHASAEAAAAARDPGTAQAVRRIVLFCLDEEWSRHLAAAQELRDGVHLQALAGRRPLDAFRDGVQAMFHGSDAQPGLVAGPASAEPGFLTRVARAAAERIAELDGERDPAALRLPRPSATWNYMVLDDPFGDAAGRAVRGLARMHRRLNGG